MPDTPEAAPEEPTIAPVTAVDETPESPELSAEAVESSTPFVGRWNELVSTTNWEKGRIIVEWRASLREGGAAVTEYSDEAWARLVGGVTSQHVGRLRRTHERFGAAFSQYPGLYWSHFQAALDWEDAEMWLEGAITNAWSVSQMRAGRWEALGEGPAPAGEVIEAQIDEDAYAALTERDAPAESLDPPFTEQPQPEDSASPEMSEGAEPSDPAPQEPAAEAAPRVRPFEELPPLPDDVADAFEQLKLVILSHKLSGWDAISRDDMVGVIESLRTLALAPSADD